MIFVIIAAIFIGLGAFVVYFVRKKRTDSSVGSDFTILEE